jgi:hypothetical protein
MDCNIKLSLLDSKENLLDVLYNDTQHLAAGGTYEFSDTHPMPDIEVPGKCWSCTTFFKIYNLSCTNFWEKNQPKNTTNGVLTGSSMNDILLC